MRFTLSHLKSSTALAALIAVAGTTASAQDTAADTDDAVAFEEIVVLGTPGGAGVRKQDASFAITTMNEEAIGLAGTKSPQSCSRSCLASGLKARAVSPARTSMCAACQAAATHRL